VRFEVDFLRAALLALLQVAICGSVALPILWLARRPAETAASGTVFRRPDSADRGVRALDVAILALGALLVLPPLAAVALSGLAGIGSLLGAEVLQASATSCVIAVPAAALAVSLALMLGVPGSPPTPRARVWRVAGTQGAGGLILAVPPLALSAGLFVIVRRVADPFALAIPFVILVNALMALPFALRQVEPPLVLASERYGRLAASLAISGVARLRIVHWPLLKRPLSGAFAVALALSLGDLGVAAFFGSGTILTLPLLLHQRLGAYRMEEAASVALLLAILVLLLFLGAQKWSGDPLARSR
jgi:thiamine transport system permease protein